MSFLISAVCIVLIVFSFQVDRRIYSPMVLFNFWWGITVLISGLGLFGMFIPSTSTYAIILFSILSFNYPCFIFLMGKNRFKTKPEPNANVDFGIRQALKFLIFMQIVGIIILARRSITVFNLLLSGLNYSAIRYEYYYSDNIMSGYDHLINAWFISPVVTFSIILFSILLVEKKHNKLLLITTLLYVGLFSFSSGGRSLIVIFGLAFFIVYLMHRNEIKFVLTQKLKYSIFIFLMVSLLIYITFSRTTGVASMYDILKTTVVYFTGAYIYFEKISLYPLQDGNLLYGGAFLGGIIDIFVLILRYIGFDINQIASYIDVL
jgi:oligosaccharide repeat unit polymerase